jgi:two-component system phosphate regulon sensor histidine kinase PhoR
MPRGKLPNVTSRLRTAPVKRVDRSAAESVVIDASRTGFNGLQACGDSDDTAEGSQRQAVKRSYASLPSSVIHELRTPLTSIHGYAQVLQRTLRDEPRAANALNVVVRESSRLSGMLAALSELAELDGETEPLPVMHVETDQIVDGVIHEVARRDAQAHPIEMSGRGTARCNPTGLSQSLLHVLTNAVRYSEAGVPVSVTIREAEGGVIIEVSDQGIGMESDDTGRLYQPFQRGANARQSGVRGLGLGLFLARETLQQMGGRIEHECRADGGTTFRITVPRARVG